MNYNAEQIYADKKSLHTLKYQGASYDILRFTHLDIPHRLSFAHV